MRRRPFLVGLAAAATTTAAGRSQTRAGGAGRIGFLHPRTAAPDSPTVAELRPSWERLGYVESETFLLRSAGNEPGRLRDLAAELAALGAGVVIAVGLPAIRAAIPTGLPVVGIDLEADPIRSGLVASLARPGGNVTGLFLDQPSLAGKWLALLTEAAPRTERVGVFWDPSAPPDQRDAALNAVRAAGLAPILREVATPDDHEKAFAGLGETGRMGIIKLGAPGTSVTGRRFAALALGHRLPTVTHQRFLAVDGALISYGPSRDGSYWPRSVVLAHRILRGERAGEIPVERPDRFELVVNLATARAVGLALSNTLLAQADEVIE